MHQANSGKCDTSKIASYKPQGKLNGKTKKKVTRARLQPVTSALT